MTITEQLALFTRNTDLAAVPPEVVAHAKELILDSCAVMIAGATEDCTQIAGRMIDATGALGDAFAVSSGQGVSVLDAALINGIASHSLEMDESTAGGHSSSVIFPALMALSESRSLSGRDLLAAYVVGMELQNRLGLAAAVRIYWRGQHQVSHVGGLAAAMASARLIGLDANGIRTAAGLAATSNGGLRKNLGSMAKRLHAGNSARNAVQAALLAEGGFGASLDIIDGAPAGMESGRVRRDFAGGGKPAIDHGHVHYGWLNALCGDDNYDLAPLTEGLGKSWFTVPQRTMFRFFPCSTAAFVPIELALKLRTDHAIDPAQVAAIELGVSTDAMTGSGWTQVTTGEQTRFSIPYAVVVALLDGEATIEKFGDVRVAQPDIQAFLRKVRIAIDPEADEALQQERKAGLAAPMSGHWARVTIRLQDGRAFSATGNSCRGSWRNPASFADLAAKLRLSARYSGFDRRPGVDIDRLVAVVANLESLPTVTELTAAMGHRSAAADRRSQPSRAVS